jgi:predicted transcriptional regulator
MAGVFDRLQNKIEDKKDEGGITALDLVDLSPSLRSIMRLMLRRLKMTYPEVCAAVDSMPEKQRMSHDEVKLALNTLTKQFWLIRLGEGDSAIYKVNLRAKAGSTLKTNIWASLGTKLDE